MHKEHEHTEEDGTRHNRPRREEDRLARFISAWWPVILGIVMVIGSWWQNVSRVDAIERDAKVLAVNISKLEGKADATAEIVVSHDKQIALIQQDITFIKKGVDTLLKRD